MTVGTNIRTGRRLTTSGVVLVSLVLGCGYPTYEFVPDDATIEASDDTAPADGGTDAPVDARTDTSDALVDASDTIADTTDAETPGDTAPCPILTGGDACSTIPKFGSDKQVVDGIGDEFCGVPATKLIANAGPHMLPTPPPTGIDTVMWTRIAWSPIAIHIHIRVDQAMVFPPTSTEELWRGDAIELFLSGSNTLTGDYTAAKEPGTFQLIGVAPRTDTPARCGVYYGSDGLQTFLDSAHFAARITPTGYELELKIDWTSLKATPASGKAIGFDAAVDVRQTEASSLQLQSFIGFRPVTVTTPCSGTRGPHPSCDDRTWCVPTLE